MIKAKLDNGPVILGLNGESIARLIAGEPILLNLTDLGLPHQQIAIMYGPTEADIKGEIMRAANTGVGFYRDAATESGDKQSEHVTAHQEDLDEIKERFATPPSESGDSHQPEVEDSRPE